MYELQLDNNAGAALCNIFAALGEGIASDRTCRHWFKSFQGDDISLEDYPRSGRPLECDVEHLQALIEDNPRLIIHEFSIVFDCNYSTIDHQLDQLGKVNKFG